MPWSPSGRLPHRREGFYFVKRIDGKPTRVKLGTADELSVDDAREAARVKAGEVAKGENPQAARRARREEAHLSGLWESTWNFMLSPERNRGRMTSGSTRSTWAVGGKRLSAITRAVVARWHGAIAKDHGPVQANRCKALLATMFSKASAAVGYSGPNPAIGVANFPEGAGNDFFCPPK